MTTSLTVADGYLAKPVMAELRLTAWRFLPDLKPAMMVSLRMAMGGGLGAALGAAAGNLGFWAAAGVAVGVALDRVVSGASVARLQIDKPREPGLYRLGR